ncbi:hypothetical protein VM98_10410 [Streptomyces rubellomurinus subsp. indigoferus]|nr:hypothetical protein VM98_10410 [Streptomyces rubellomurinus subsp. indigoferus]
MICDTQFIAFFVIYDTPAMGLEVDMPRSVNTGELNDHMRSQLLWKRPIEGALLYQLCSAVGKFLGAMLT